MAKVIELLQLMWETCTEFLAPGFGLHPALAQLQLLQAFVSKQANGSSVSLSPILSLPLSLSASQNKLKNEFKNLV